MIDCLSDDVNVVGSYLVSIPDTTAGAGYLSRTPAAKSITALLRIAVDVIADVAQDMTCQ